MFQAGGTAGTYARRYIPPEGNVRGFRGRLSSYATDPEGKLKPVMGLRDRLEALERAQSPIRIGLVGAGQMGRGFVAQVEGIPGMGVVAAADLDPERALEALRASGREPGEGQDGGVGSLRRLQETSRDLDGVKTC
jgi:hypothetical protein